MYTYIYITGKLFRAHIRIYIHTYLYREAIQGPHHPEVAVNLISIASILRNHGQVHRYCVHMHIYMTGHQIWAYHVYISFPAIGFYMHEYIIHSCTHTYIHKYIHTYVCIHHIHLAHLFVQLRASLCIVCVCMYVLCVYIRRYILPYPSMSTLCVCVCMCVYVHLHP